MAVFGSRVFVVIWVQRLSQNRISGRSLSFGAACKAVGTAGSMYLDGEVASGSV